MQPDINPDALQSENVFVQSTLDATTLSDDFLASSGLRKVSAFVRAPKSANALRVKKAREKTREGGSGQVNVTAPVAVHTAIKSIAKELQNGKTICKVLEGALQAELKTVNPQASVQVISGPDAELHEQIAGRLVRLEGWRRWLAKLIGLL